MGFPRLGVLNSASSSLFLTVDTSESRQFFQVLTVKVLHHFKKCVENPRPVVRRFMPADTLPQIIDHNFKTLKISKGFSG